MRLQPSDTVEPRTGMGGQWEGEVGVVSRINHNGEVVDVRFPGMTWDVPFARIELKLSQQKLELQP